MTSDNDPPTLESTAPGDAHSSDVATRRWTKEWALLRRTLQSTHALLTRHGDADDADCRTLLEVTVAMIDGSEAGSLFVREGETFRARALVGLPEELLGVRYSAMQWFAWAEQHEDDPFGPRFVRKGDVVRAFAGQLDCSLTANADLAACAASSLPEPRSTLSIPIVKHGVVVAVLSLQSYTDDHAFGAHEEATAREIAEQVGSLLVAGDHRAREVARHRELETLAALNVALRPSRSPEEVEVILTQQTVVLLGTRYATLLRYDASTDVLMSTASSGEHAPPSGLILKRGQGLSWTAVDTRHVTCFPDALKDSRAYVLTPVENLATLYAPLLAASGDLLGVLAAGRGNAPFTSSEVQLAEAFASAGATALERALETRAVKETREGALLALGRALEVRDFETRGHTERVVRFADALGRAFGLSHEDLEALRQGAYLHDIGKIGLPDGVLLKPGELDPQERRLVQTHTTVGDTFVRGIPTLPMGARQVVRSHHERWDGTGYPDGLAGPDIPLLARLFTIVDVYDALRSERPYKTAWTHEQATREIAVQAGRQFDPNIVRVFVDLFDPSGG